MGKGAVKLQMPFGMRHVYCFHNDSYDDAISFYISIEQSGGSLQAICEGKLVADHFITA